MKRVTRLLSIIAILLLPLPVFGQAAFDTGSNCGTASSMNPADVTCTTSGANRVMLAWALSSSVGGGGTPDNTSASFPTYNSIAMTTVRDDTSAYADREHLFQLIAPTTGSNTLSTQWAATTMDHITISLSATGIDQTTPLRSGPAVSRGSSTPGVAVTLNCTTVAGDLVVGLFYSRYFVATGAVTADSGNTLRTTVNPGGVPGAFLSTITASGTTTTVSFTAGNSVDYAILCIPMIPAAVAASATRNLLLLGVR